ncbi:MAG: hypothetical protein Q4F60_00745, partial [Candidatus Saccharibacteria bacterium]|nr:hypothetical protein [Candidatus Saccharibacteria bacterium]
MALNFAFATPVHSIPSTPGGESSQTQNSNQNDQNNQNTNPGLPATPGGENSGNSNNNSSDNNSTDEDSTQSTTNDCYDQVGAIAWFVCPTTGWLSTVIESLYGIIENFLIIPSSMLEGDTSPIYLVWQYLKDIANIVFVIFLLVVIWSQLTGVGISNYGIKKVLPRLIISIVILNLSYFICALAIDVSNILGKSIYGFIQGVELQVVGNGSLGTNHLDIASIVTGLLAGGAATALGISIAGGVAAILPMLIGAILVCAVSILVGFFTISLRQAVVMALIMVSPIAFVLYLLPNTEHWFKKWSNLFTQMLFFYPMFSLLFSTAQLAGYTFIASSNGEAFWVILGIVVMIAPLVLSVNLMRMSGTVLGRINQKLENLGRRPVSALRRSVLDPISEQRRQSYIANANAPGASLRRYLDARRRRRAIDTDASIKTRTALADINATKMIMKDADGNSYEAGISEKKGHMRSNRYVQNLKRSQNVNLEAQYVAADRKHILGNYGSYFGENAEDYALAQESADNAKEFFRTQLTAINDDRSDMKWLTDQYKDILKQTDANGNRLSQEDLEHSYKYQHYISSATGGLGETGTDSVLGQVYARSSANEMAIQKDVHSLLSANKSLPPNFRSMMAGYLVDTQGYAVDENGRRLRNDDGSALELNPGDALSSAESRAKLVPYSRLDNGRWIDGENGAYSVLTDQKGNFITRIYRNDRPTVKEVLAGSDMPINDQMNSLYSILSGIDRGTFAREGLSDFGNNIGKNLDDAGYVKKYPGVSRFFTAAVRQGRIKNFGDFAAYTLDAIGKSSTPGAILTEDPESAKLLGNIMNPKNFSQIYTHDFFVNYENILGEKLTGTEFELDADGNIVYDERGDARFTEIPHDQATDEQFMNTILRKFIAPGATKLAGHLGHNNFRIIDNQTANTARALDDFTDSVLATYSSAEVRAAYPILPDLSDEIAFIHANNDYLRNHRQISQRQQRGTNPHQHNGYSGNNNGNNNG